jgi:hypothetical protein
MIVRALSCMMIYLKRTLSSTWTRVKIRIINQTVNDMDTVVAYNRQTGIHMPCYRSKTENKTQTRISFHTFGEGIYRVHFALL